MDISNLNLDAKAEEGSKCYLEHPITGDKLGTDDKPVYIHIKGQDSKAFKSKSREIQRRKVIKRRKSKDIDFAFTDEESAELLAAVTIDIVGLEENEKPIEFSEQAAFDLYLKNTWIREQVDLFLGDRANLFTKD